MENICYYEPDEFDIWYDNIYSKCTEKHIPYEFQDMGGGLVKNTKKIEFCNLSNDCEDQTCNFNNCIKRN